MLCFTLLQAVYSTVDNYRLLWVDGICLDMTLDAGRKQNSNNQPDIWLSMDNTLATVPWTLLWVEGPNMSLHAARKPNSSNQPDMDQTGWPNE